MQHRYRADGGGGEQAGADLGQREAAIRPGGEAGEEAAPVLGQPTGRGGAGRRESASGRPGRGTPDGAGQGRGSRGRPGQRDEAERGQAAPDLHPGKIQGDYGHYLYSRMRSVQGMSGHCLERV